MRKFQIKMVEKDVQDRFLKCVQLKSSFNLDNSIAYLYLCNVRLFL